MPPAAAANCSFLVICARRPTETRAAAERPLTKRPRAPPREDLWAAPAACSPTRSIIRACRRTAAAGCPSRGSSAALNAPADCSVTPTPPGGCEVVAAPPNRGACSADLAGGPTGSIPHGAPDRRRPAVADVKLPFRPRNWLAQALFVRHRRYRPIRRRSVAQGATLQPRQQRRHVLLRWSGRIRTAPGPMAQSVVRSRSLR